MHPSIIIPKIINQKPIMSQNNIIFIIITTLCIKFRINKYEKNWVSHVSAQTLVFFVCNEFPTFR